MPSAWYEEFAFLQGNGVGKPLGHPQRRRHTQQQPHHRRPFQLRRRRRHAAAKLLPASYARARWYISPTVVTDLLQLKDGAGRAIFLSIDQGVTRAPVWKLLNLPVTITEKIRRSAPRAT